MTHHYKITRSARKTVSLQIKQGEIRVLAPLSMSDEAIAKFVSSHEAWISKKLEEFERRRAHSLSPLSEAELKELYDAARRLIPERVRHYAELMNLSYSKISIRRQRSRWGSCSGKGNLSFNCLLMLAPPEVLDSVVVHELCHLKEMNHSKRFYAMLRHFYPDYDRCRRWLKEHGEELLELGSASF